MKLACSSAAFDRQLRSGDLTQLEWIDLCARKLATDGVVFDVAHFPRTDSDYLAQVKKMCADLGLTVAAVFDGGFFGGNASEMAGALDVAVALGAPLLSSRLPAETEASWVETLERLNAATSMGKRANVTLGLRNAARTFAASTHDVKRVSKEADSAWLRYAPDFGAFDASDQPADLLPKTVLAWYSVVDSRQVRPLVALLSDFRGFVALDAPAESPQGQAIVEILSSLRDERLPSVRHS
ncbi:MAG: sugar phosphate isomerase/epimerase [Candidatus Eremiobacteraeota bacterium]|nr:sugar phosphate isomerase/epimerase [Candidatus Eremiobacteraeota bacterium]